MNTINLVFVVGNKSVLKFFLINISFKRYIRILHHVLFLHSELIWYRIFTINSFALANERNLIKAGGIPRRSELSLYIASNHVICLLLPVHAQVEYLFKLPLTWDNELIRMF